MEFLIMILLLEYFQIHEIQLHIIKTKKKTVSYIWYEHLALFILKAIVWFALLICNIVLSVKAVLHMRNSGKRQSRRNSIYSWERKLRNAITNTSV